MKMTVIGCGYLGATHAACMAELGHDVLGVDVDAAKTAALAAGETPFFEPGLDDVLRRNIAAGRLRFTTDTAEAARLARVHFLCVGTPQQPTSGAADLTALRTAVRALVGHLRGHHLVVGKSTVPVGTCAELDDEIAALTRDADSAAAAGSFTSRDNSKPVPTVAYSSAKVGMWDGSSARVTAAMGRRRSREPTTPS